MRLIIDHINSYPFIEVQPNSIIKLTKNK